MTSGRISGEGSCQIIALREAADHPQVVSTSRHITQGLVDVVSEEWFPERKLLRGRSRVVAADPYELRIICPPGFKAAEAAVADTSATVSRIEQDGKLLRVTIIPSETGALEWAVRF